MDNVVAGIIMAELEVNSISIYSKLKLSGCCYSNVFNRFTGINKNYWISERILGSDKFNFAAIWQPVEGENH